LTFEKLLRGWHIEVKAAKKEWKRPPFFKMRIHLAGIRQFCYKRDARLYE